MELEKNNKILNDEVEVVINIQKIKYNEKIINRKAEVEKIKINYESRIRKLEQNIEEIKESNKIELNKIVIQSIFGRNMKI